MIKIGLQPTRKIQRQPVLRGHSSILMHRVIIFRHSSSIPKPLMAVQHGAHCNGYYSLKHIVVGGFGVKKRHLNPPYVTKILNFQIFYSQTN